MLTHVTFKYVYNFYLATDLSHPNTSPQLAQKGMNADGRWRTHSLNISSSFLRSPYKLECTSVQRE